MTPLFARTRHARAPIIAALAVTMAVTSGALTANAASGDVNFLYLWGGEPAKTLEELISGFNASQTDVHMTGISSPDIQKQIVSMAAADGSFDLSDQLGDQIGSLASKGVLEPLDDYIARDNYDLSDIIPATLDQQKYNGKIYALPIAAHDELLMYNKKLFEEAGIDGPPQTTADFITAIEKLTKTDADGNITQMGFALQDDIWSFLTMSLVHGASWFGDDGKPTPDLDANIAACQFYMDNVVNKYGADKVAAFKGSYGGWSDPTSPFYAGKIAMIIDGEWQASWIDLYAKDLDWDVANVPYLDGHPEFKDFHIMNTSNWIIPANAKNKDGAWEAMKYLMTPDSQRTFNVALANLPTLKSLVDDPEINAIPGFSGWYGALAAEDTHAWSSASFSAQYRSDLGTAINNAFLGQGSCADNLHQVAQNAALYEYE